MPEINYEDFAKVELKVGTIISAEAHPNADKLLVLQVDLGEESSRQIVAGIKAAYDPLNLPGKQIVVVTNLAPVILRGVQSNGMLLAAKSGDVLSLITTDHSVTPGTGAK